MPINIAIAGYNSTADAHQTNDASFDQSAVQIAGIGGDGGSGNVSIGGSVTASGFGSGDSGAISTGGNQAGNGGDGFFHGSISHASFILYDPINIAMAGNNSSAHADQMNNVDINQSAVQMAGIGGNGGHGNIALGGSVRFFPPASGSAPTRSIPATTAPATAAAGISREVSSTPALRFMLPSTLRLPATVRSTTRLRPTMCISTRVRSRWPRSAVMVATAILR